MTAPRIRVVVVDDSAFARKVLREVLNRDPRIEVVGTARDGLEGIERVAELQPDVVTLDLVMPNLDGVGLLAALPDTGGPRVVVVSMSDVDSELALTALENGAVDLVHKPTTLATDRLFELSAELCEKVVTAAGAIRPRRKSPSERPSFRANAGSGGTRVVVLGTSTGGPQALSRLVPALPESFPAPVVVALHIPEGYTEALARRLDQVSALNVVEATDAGVDLVPGVVVIARGGAHVTIARIGDRHVARVDASVTGLLYLPSVDHLFHAAAREFGSQTLGVVMTGMGDDGLAGARSIREAGGSVLVESESSCIVHGMPRAVREAGLATGEAPLDGMVTRILSAL